MNNPYIGLTGIISAGLFGIKNKLKLRAPCLTDPADNERLNPRLPTNLA